MTKIIKNIPQHANTTSTPSTPDAGFSKIYPKTDLKWYLLDENGLETPIGSIEGTLNYIPKWTPDGSTIGNSLIYDSGTNVGIGSSSPLSKLYVNSSIQNESITLNNDDITGSSYFGLSQSGGIKAGMILLNSNHPFIPKTLIVRNLWDNGGIRINGGSGDTNIMYFDTTTFNVGIGTTTPTSKLDVNGQVVAGLGGGIVTSNDSPFYAVRLNTGNPNYYSGFQYVFEVGGGVWGIGMSYVNNEFQFLTNGASTAKFVYGDGNSASPNSKFVMDLNGGFFGANIASPTANIHAKGIDATSSNYALKVDNSANSPLLYVRNDGNVGFGTSSPTAKLHVVGLLEYTDNADALANGLTIGAFYRTGDLLKVVH